MLAQTRPGARGMLMFDGCVRPAEFGTPWPSAVPVQIHGMENDPYFIVSARKCGELRKEIATNMMIAGWQPALDRGPGDENQ